MRDYIPAPAEVFLLVSGISQFVYLLTRADLGYWSLVLPSLQFLMFGPILVLELFGAAPNRCKIVKTLILLLSFAPSLVCEIWRGSAR